jgi:tRNA dimethylallyltransferase
MDGTLIIIAGPTAVGKTDLSLALATALDAEIISADSMQVYRHMNIGTAKPTLVQQQLVKHHLLNVVDPDQYFSVADYQSHFNLAVRDILNRGKIPLMVGGTGLYIRACTQSFVFDPGGADPLFREQLRLEAKQFGVAQLYERLQMVDPISALKIHPNDLLRIIRTLEVFHSTGLPISELQLKRNLNAFDRLIYLFFDRDRMELYQRIEQRVDAMIAAGLADEVRTLLEMGYSPELKPMQSLGYRQIAAFLRQDLSWESAVTEIKKATRNYGKRQLTWFRKEPVDWWINISGSGQELIGEILNYIEGRLHQTSNK